MFDKDGYPTENALNEIRKWDAFKDVWGLIDYLEDIWKYPNYFKREDNLLELHTGGWSGNESVIGALEANKFFWLLYWQKSERGGHYYFKIKGDLSPKEKP